MKRMFAAGHVLPDQDGFRMFVMQYEDYGKVSTITKFKKSTEPDYPYLGDDEEPIQANLGCATTQELLEEIKARIDVDVSIGWLPERVGEYFNDCLEPTLTDLEYYGRLNYRTVDGR